MQKTAYSQIVPTRPKPYKYYHVVQTVREMTAKRIHRTRSLIIKQTVPGLKEILVRHCRSDFDNLTRY